MEISELLAAVNSEIAILKQARALLTGRDGLHHLPGGKPRRKRHTMSAEGRARIAAAQRARWAKQKKAK